MQQDAAFRVKMALEAGMLTFHHVIVPEAT